MGQKWSSTQKVCATCEYWAGKREVDPPVYRYVRDFSKSGKCLLKGGPRWNCDQPHGANCSKYRKWAVLY